MMRTMLTSEIHRATVTQADLHYVIPGERGSGVIGVNGAAAHLVHPGDLVFLIGYGRDVVAS